MSKILNKELTDCTYGTLSNHKLCGFITGGNGPCGGDRQSSAAEAKTADTGWCNLYVHYTFKLSIMSPGKLRGRL